MLTQPIGVYLNWSSYDELSDNVELTEELALHQLDELIRLRKHGVDIEYYVMDAFWFAKDGGYRQWRKPHWKNGPDTWLQKCLDNDIKPGMWFGANNPAWMHPIEEWMDSFDPQTGCMCCFYGGFLPHYIESLELWYEHGVRLFKLDFADFSAAPPGIKESLLPSEIRSANVIAFRGALKAFRQRHPDALIIAYNGFEERSIQNTTDELLAKVMDTRWLEVFDTIYCGDARPSDVPAMNFWRSKDIYSDHMVRQYERNNLPLQRIDNAGFMIGTTGTCYYRGKEAWRGMLILSLARGGLNNTYYGNLDLLSDEDARWLATVQKAFFDIHRSGGNTESFGGLPGAAEIYGFISANAKGGLISVVNPSQEFKTISLPTTETSSLLFTDSGFEPLIKNSEITLGAEQMALLAYGDAMQPDFGQEMDISIPETITKLDISFEKVDEKSIRAEYQANDAGIIRVILRQVNAQGRAVRSYGGSPPEGKTLAELLRIEAEQAGEKIPITINYDRAVWSGLSWAAGEISISDCSKPVFISCSTTEKQDIHLEASLYLVSYASREK